MNTLWHDRICILMADDAKRKGTKAKFLSSIAKQMPNNPAVPTQKQLVYLTRFWNSYLARQTEEKFGINLVAEV